MKISLRLSFLEKPKNLFYIYIKESQSRLLIFCVKEVFVC